MCSRYMIVLFVGMWVTNEPAHVTRMDSVLFSGKKQ